MIYVDDWGMKVQNQNWYHLMSDTEDDEIHIFAKKLGLKREWFQVDHYDIAGSKRQQAIKLGAIQVKPEDLVKIRKDKRMRR